MHFVVQKNCAELIYFLLVMKCYLRIVYTFYFVCIQFIIQPDGEFPTEVNMSISLYVFNSSMWTRLTHRAYGCLRLIIPHYYYYYFIYRCNNQTERQDGDSAQWNHINKNIEEIHNVSQTHHDWHYVYIYIYIYIYL